MATSYGGLPDPSGGVVQKRVRRRVDEEEIERPLRML